MRDFFETLYVSPGMCVGFSKLSLFSFFFCFFFSCCGSPFFNFELFMYSGSYVFIYLCMSLFGSIWLCHVFIFIWLEHLCERT